MKLVLSIAGLALGGVLLAGVALGAVSVPTAFVGDDTFAPLAPSGPIANDTKDPGRLATVLERLVQQGVITRDQADKILAAMKSAAGARLELKHDLVGAAAGALGISVDALRAELPGKSLAQVAQAHGVPRDTLVEKLTTAVNADIEKARVAGKITLDQANALRAKAPELVSKGVDRVFPAAKPRVVDRAKNVIGDVVRDAARIIGISTAQLKQELPGRSIAQVAQAHGMQRDTLVQRLVADANAKIDEAQRGGKLGADQAQRAKDAAPAAIAKIVDRVTSTR